MAVPIIFHIVTAISQIIKCNTTNTLNIVAIHTTYTINIVFFFTMTRTPQIEIRRS